MDEFVTKSYRSIPDAFYDIIVYMGSSIVFFFFLITIAPIEELLEDIVYRWGLLDKIILVVAAVAFGYIYGQLASTLSYHFVKRPMNRIVRRFRLKSSSDYFFDYPSLLEDFEMFDRIDVKKKDRNYWTLIYYIKMIHPDVGSDMVKRYARCKLARIGAFNFLVLIVLAISLFASGIATSENAFLPGYLDPIAIVGVLLLLLVASWFEFYQRQSWFGDFLVKVYIAFSKRHGPQ
jgi:hypothetical protein